MSGLIGVAIGNPDDHLARLLAAEEEGRLPPFLFFWGHTPNGDLRPPGATRPRSTTPSSPRRRGRRTEPRFVVRPVRERSRDSLRQPLLLRMTSPAAGRLAAELRSLLDLAHVASPVTGGDPPDEGSPSAARESHEARNETRRRLLVRYGRPVASAGEFGRVAAVLSEHAPDADIGGLEFDWRDERRVVTVRTRTPGRLIGRHGTTAQAVRADLIRRFGDERLQLNILEIRHERPPAST